MALTSSLLDSVLGISTGIIRAAIDDDVAKILQCPLLGKPLSGLDMFDTGTTRYVKQAWSLMTEYGVVSGLPLRCTEYQEVVSADVGQQVVLRKDGGNVTVIDNIAPKPRVWRIKGYVLTDRLLGTGIESSFVKQVVTNNYRKLQRSMIKDYIRTLVSSRSPITFVTQEGNEEACIVSSATLNDDPLEDNALAIDIQLVEYVTLSMTLDNGTSVKNVPRVGTSLIKAMDSGVIQGNFIAGSINTVTKSVMSLFSLRG